MNPINWQKQIDDMVERHRTPGSHEEDDPEVFHASQVGYCKRQIYLKKVGADSYDKETLRKFHVGTRIHEEFEEEIQPRIPAVFEVPTKRRFDEYGVTVIGHADVYTGDAVEDFKTRGSWYRHNPPVQRHLDQLFMYMLSLKVGKGRIVYVSKKDYEVRTYPESGMLELDEQRVFQELLPKLEEVKEAVKKAPEPEYEEDVPFEKCGCWICDNEETNLKRHQPLDAEEEKLDA